MVQAVCAYFAKERAKACSMGLCSLHLFFGLLCPSVRLDGVSRLIFQCGDFGPSSINERDPVSGSSSMDARAGLQVICKLEALPLVT